jgi:hypothetical protein
MTSNSLISLTYARARLFLGISNVGFWVLCALFVLLKPQIAATNISVFALPLVLILGNLPFDVLGGYILPKHFGRLPEAITTTRFVSHWTRGVLGQYLSLTLFIGLFQSMAENSIAMKLGFFVVVQVTLYLCQYQIACLIGNLRPAFVSQEERDALAAHSFLVNYSVSELIFLASSDPGFVGGWHGSKLVLPDAWRTELSPDVLATQVLRRIAVNQSGARMRGVVLAILFNTSGFALSLTYGHSLISMVAINTLWAFLGVLTLPTLSRGAVFAADRFALDAGVSTEILQQTIIALDKRQDDEPERSQGIETIFHPIPSVNRRLVALERGDKTHTRGGWQTLRTALYLSWASGSFLSRAVHCNIGRPELWVFFPGD